MSVPSASQAPSPRQRIARKAGVVNRELFIERDRDHRRTALILGSGRSGTTWLAEVIARHFGSRLLFEPFHPLWSPEVGRRLFIGPDQANADLEARTNEIMSGRVRKRQVDQILISRRPRGRVIKDIHTTNLAPWFRRRYPSVPVIFVIRHPVATSHSRRKGGTWYGISTYLKTGIGRADAEDSPTAAWLPAYDEHSADPEPLVRLVAEWCIENAYPLSRAATEGITLTFYEDTVLDPVEKLGQLGDLCRDTLDSSADGRIALDDARRPSAKDSFGTAANARRSDRWNEILGRWTREVSPGVTERCLRVLADFGLSGFYGDGPMPLESPSTTRSQR